MMYTFDNTFQVSFLFRDGCIAFVKDKEGLPAIKPLDVESKPPKPSEMTSFTSNLSQQLIQVVTLLEHVAIKLFILLNSFFFPQKYTQKYNIREPMLKISRE